jgi:hypothetical protein
MLTRIAQTPQSSGKRSSGSLTKLCALLAGAALTAAGTFPNGNPLGGPINPHHSTSPINPQGYLIFVDKKDLNFNEDAERFRIKSQLDLAIGTDPHKFTSNIEAFLTKARLTPKNLGVIARLDKAVKTMKRKNK